jgi:hypothetical protein
MPNFADEKETDMITSNTTFTACREGPSTHYGSGVRRHFRFRSRRRVTRPFRWRRVRLERLEDRTVPATVVWDGGPSGQGTNWLDPVNWVGDLLPGPSDDAVIGLASQGQPANVTLTGTAAVHSATVIAGTININPNGGYDGGGGALSVDSLSQSGGTISVGWVGLLTINGSFSQTGGVLGVTAADVVYGGPLYSHIQVGGTVALGGSLNVSVVPVNYFPHQISFRVIDNVGPDPVSGTFAGLPEGARMTAGSQRVNISYLGGTGNDVVLTPAGPVTVVWDGGPTGQGTNWLDPVNWSEDAPPRFSDDVVIGPLAGGPTLVTLTTGIESVGIHNLAVTGSTLRLDRATLAAPYGKLITNSGTIELTGETVSTDATRLVTSGLITNAPGATISLLGGPSRGRELGGSIDNQGTITVAATSFWYNAGASTNAGTIDVTAGNSLTLNGNYDWASFANTGAVTVAAGGTLTVTDNPYTQAGGTTTVAGTLTVNAAFTQTGGITAVAGTLTVNGAFGQNGDTTEVALNGSIPGSQYGQIRVNGTVNLGGATLSTIFAPDYVPPFGTTFTIIDNDGTDAITGTFAGLPEGATVAAGGQDFRVSYIGGTGNDVTLRRVGPAPLASLTAYSVQTGPQTLTDSEPYVIEVQGRFASMAPGPMSQVIAPDDYPFVASRALLAPFAAPRLAVADVNGDRLLDLIVAAGSNSLPLITVVDGVRLFGPQAGQRLRPEDLLAQFVAYDPTFLGGVYVAAGDFNGDGRAEIVTGAGEGGGPHVRTFQYDASATALGDRMKPFAGVVGNFFAYDPAFRGGVRVAVGDVDGDGTPDVITGAGNGGGPHVRALSGVSGAVLLDFFAYDAGFRGGVYVAAGDIDGDGRADIVTGAGEGGGPHVKVFSGNGGGLLMSFFAYDTDFRGGVHVAAGDLNGDGTIDIVTGPGEGGGPHVKVFSDVGGPVIGSFMAYDQSLRFGVAVAAGP